MVCEEKRRAVSLPVGLFCDGVAVRRAEKGGLVILLKQRDNFLAAVLSVLFAVYFDVLAWISIVTA